MKFVDLDMGDKQALIEKARKRYERATRELKDTSYDITIMFANGEIESFGNAHFVLPATEDSRMIYIEEFTGAMVIVMVDQIAMMRYRERSKK